MTVEEALGWVERLFEEAPGKLSPDTHQDEIDAWDSLGVLTLMSGLDSDFGIVITDEHLPNITKVSDILELLRSNGVLLESQVAP